MESTKESRFPIRFQWMQFSVLGAYYITFNRAQGQTLKQCGLHLPHSVLLTVSCTSDCPVVVIRITSLYLQTKKKCKNCKTKDYCHNKDTTLEML
jgi:hypothetical protein